MLSSSFTQGLSFTFTVSSRVSPKNALLWDGTENLNFVYFRGNYRLLRVSYVPTKVSESLGV